jgi:hypothetical protein
VFIVAQNPVSEKLQFEKTIQGGGAKNLIGGSVKKTNIFWRGGRRHNKTTVYVIAPLAWI